MTESVPFRATWILEDTLRDLRRGQRYIWHEGGSRASKTYNICAAILLYVAETQVTVDIVRLSNPDIKGSVLLDLVEVADRLGLYDPALHHKTDQVIQLCGGRGRIRYFGIENEQKVRGWKRDVLWMNEANEISDAKRRQLWMRTTQSIVLDHNPTVDDDHWIVQRLEPRVAKGECKHYHSTYKDNPFLEEAIIREIEAMRYDDPWGWKVYGLGERASNPAAVFTDVSLGAFEPQGDTIYGVDFGMKDPFVVCEWGWRDSNPPKVPKASLYCRPIVYATNLITSDAIKKMDAQGVSKSRRMYCDSAEPDRIAELRRAGYNAVPAHKAPGVREAGYDWLKKHRFVIDHTSDLCEPVKNELRRTRHKPLTGESDVFTDKIKDVDDHVADSARYGPYSLWGPKEETLVGADMMYI